MELRVMYALHARSFVGFGDVLQRTDGTTQFVSEVFVLRDRTVIVPVRWSFPGGQMEIRTPLGTGEELPTGDDAVATRLGDENAAAVTAWRAAYFGAEPRYAEGFALFQPRPATRRESRVPPANADFFELEGSVDGDWRSPFGSHPCRILRLGWRHDEIVLELAPEWGDAARRITVERRLDAALTADRDVIASVFGEQAAAIASWFVSDRARHFR